MYRQGTLAYIPPHLHHTVKFVIPWDETDEYKVGLKSDDKYMFLVTPPGKGIAWTRRWIGSEAALHKQPKFVMMDDDLKFFVRKGYDSTSLIQQSPDDFRRMLESIDLTLRHFAAVGVSARQGNNNSGTGDEFLCEYNTRLLRVLAYQTTAFNECEHCRVEIAEDHDINLQLLKKGLPNANLMYWSQDQAQTQAPGGCSTYRTHELHERSQRKLAELHPGLVKIVQKQNKTGGAFGSRIESVIYWKKAYEQGSKE